MGLGSTTPNFNTVSHIWINICIIQIKQCTFTDLVLGVDNTLADPE